MLAELNFRYVEEPLRCLGSERAKRKLAALETSDSGKKDSFVRLN
jgi:hypothetical protein